MRDKKTLLRAPSFKSEKANSLPAVDPELIARVKADKARRRSSSVQYRDRSEIAFVVHSFNRVSNIDQLLTGLR